MLRLRAGLAHRRVTRSRALLLVVGMTSALLAQAAPAFANYAGTGSKPLAIILCKWSNSPATDAASASYFNDMLGDAGYDKGEYTLEDYYHDVSFGQLNMSGTQVLDGAHADSEGWYTMPETSDTWDFTDGNGHSQIASGSDRYERTVECENQAEQDFDLSNYWGVVAIYPEVGGSLVDPISATDTSLVVNDSPAGTHTADTTNNWPNPPFMTIIGGANSEIVDVTAITDNPDGTATFTITRGADGSTAAAHSVGDSIGFPSDWGASTVGQDGGTPSLGQVILPSDIDLTNAAHEVGHNYGFVHSRDMSDSTNDYTDAADLMSADTVQSVGGLGTPYGLINGAHKGPGLNAVNLDYQGWVPSSRIDTFDNSTSNVQTVTLHTISDPNALTDNSDPLEAQIPATVTIQDDQGTGKNVGNPAPSFPPDCSNNDCTTSSHYDVDLRDNIGFDSGFPNPFVELHLNNAESTHKDHSYLVNESPEGVMTADGGGLKAGDDYADPDNDVYVAVNSIDGESATVTLSSTKITPSLSYSGPDGGDYGTTATLSGTLMVDSSPVPQQAVTIGVGSESCNAKTGDNGTASCQVSLDQAPGNYPVTMSTAGDQAYDAASLPTGTTFKISQNTTSTALVLSPNTLTATITPEPESGATAPTGDVVFAVDDRMIGTEPVANDQASLPYTGDQSGSHTFTATYAGDSNYTGSSGSATRSGPAVSYSVSSASGETPYHWYDSPVKVTFQCTPSTTPVTNCPAPVTLADSKADQYVTRTATQLDGATTTIKAGPFNIDRIPPTVQPGGVKDGGVYDAPAPKLTCDGSDKTSGIASCTVDSVTSKSGHTHYKLIAIDKAGNITTVTGNYQTLSLFVRHARYKNKAFVLKTTKQYTVGFYSTSKPTFFGPAEVATGKRLRFTDGQTMTKQGHHVWTVTIRIPTKAQNGTWEIGTDNASGHHVLRLDVT